MPLALVLAFAISKWDGDPTRWFEFQRATTVRWHVDERVDIAQRAVAAWNNVPGAVIAYEVVAGGAGSAGTKKRDGRNSILFGDPNDEVPGTYDCVRGGVIAMANTWVDEAPSLRYREGNARPILEADVVFNDGVECAAPSTIEEALGHELGHTLGFAHPCHGRLRCEDFREDDALMRASVHMDGRGARLSEDDQDVARELYTREGPVLTWHTQASGRSVRFAATSAAQSYEWDFGDGAKSYEAAPVHVYANAGTYTVRLRANDETGTNEIVQTIEVRDLKRRAARH